LQDDTYDQELVHLVDLIFYSTQSTYSRINLQVDKMDVRWQTCSKKDHLIFNNRPRQHPTWGRSIPMYLAKYFFPFSVLLFWLCFLFAKRNKKMNNFKNKIKSVCLVFYF
jgi:hypothetical protein